MENSVSAFSARGTRCIPDVWRSSQAAFHHHIRIRAVKGIKSPLPILPQDRLLCFHRSKVHHGTLCKPVFWRPCSLEAGSSPGYQCLSFTLHTGRCSGPSGTAEFLPASISQPRSIGTRAIYHSEQVTREGSTQRWSSRAAGEANTLEHSCARSRLLCKGTFPWQVLNLIVKFTIWKREYLYMSIHKNPGCLLLSLMPLIN